MLNTMDPIYFLITCTILGLVVGSFLNVVIYRLPLILQRNWRNECCELLALKKGDEGAFNLASPPSHCPQCKMPVRAWQNIPVLSFIFLKGRCAHCKVRISWRYPFVELLTGGLTLWVAWHFGISLQTVMAIIFTWCLIALTFIDLDHQLLPDNITLPLLWLGLLVNLTGLFTDIQSAVLGAAAGYLSLWIIARIFYHITGKTGMGHGDFKLFAAFGAWLGWQKLLLIIMCASVLGLIVGVILIVSKKHSREIPISFGPYLAIAGWIALLWSDKLLSLYWQWMQ